MSSEVCSVSRAFCACASVRTRLDGMPLGRRPLCAAFCCCTPLLANQAGLNACCAAAPPTMPPAISNRVMACASGCTCNDVAIARTPESFCCFTITVTRRKIVR
ncbi:hypothetical protein D3C73_1194300 [compost metagenome]